MKTLIVAVAAAAAVSLLSSSAAHADAPGETATHEPARRDVAHKRVRTAYLYSWAATTAPLLVGGLSDFCGGETCAASLGMVGVAGLVFGPSAGQWYAGEGVTTGLVLRGGAATAVIFLALRDPHLDTPVLTVGGLLAAVGVWEAGVIWDLATLPRAVRRHNRKVDMLVAPVVTDRSAGLALAGRW
ncbi:MAG TPA: hypothetical protein VM261_19970 [Kofleriaceae bacterium]|nr:hypothetical protein [Kofleriaceae bacterium]